MSTEYCLLHKQKHESDYGWRYQQWELTDDTKEYGWICIDFNEAKYPEFVPQKFHEERKKYLKSQIQSHRQGELSKEFVECYPDKIKNMVKAGVVTKEEVRRAKNVWTDLPNYHNLKNTE